MSQPSRRRCGAGRGRSEPAWSMETYQIRREAAEALLMIRRSKTRWSATASTPIGAAGLPRRGRNPAFRPARARSRLLSRLLGWSASRNLRLAAELLRLDGGPPCGPGARPRCLSSSSGSGGRRPLLNPAHAPIRAAPGLPSSPSEGTNPWSRPATSPGTAPWAALGHGCRRASGVWAARAQCSRALTAPLEASGHTNLTVGSTARTDAPMRRGAGDGLGGSLRPAERGCAQCPCGCRRLPLWRERGHKPCCPRYVLNCGAPGVESAGRRQARHAVARARRDSPATARRGRRDARAGNRARLEALADAILTEGEAVVPEASTGGAGPVTGRNFPAASRDVP